MEKFNRRWLAAWTAKDVEALLGFYTPDTLYFDQQTAAGIQGHEALAAYLTGLFGMTPPMRYEAEEVWAIKGGFCGRWYCTIGDAAAPALRGFDLVLMDGDRIAHNEVYVHTLGAGRVSLPIVTDPYAVDPAWLTAALNRAGVAAKVEGFTTEKVGDGMLGESVRYNLAYAAPAPGAPTSVVGKFPSANPVSRATGGAIGLYLNEVRFYQEIAHTVDIRTPKPFVAEINTETFDFTLLLEDMGPARGGNQLIGCSLADAEVAMQEAAALHGPRWGDPTLSEVEFLNRPAIEGAGIAAMFGGIIAAFRARYEDRLEPEYMAICQDFADNIGAFYSGPAAPKTLQHLDFRLDNMLFEPQGGRWPLAVLDWQSVALGAGVLDVAYFIGAGLPTEIRQKHEQDLLKQWLEALRKYGVSYDWNEAWTGYRHYLLQGVFTAIFASVSTKQTDRGDEMFLTMARRHCAQAADLESMKLLRG